MCDSNSSRVFLVASLHVTSRKWGERGMGAEGRKEGFDAGFDAKS